MNCKAYLSKKAFSCLLYRSPPCMLKPMSKANWFELNMPMISDTKGALPSVAHLLYNCFCPSFVLDMTMSFPWRTLKGSDKPTAAFHSRRSLDLHKNKAEKCKLPEAVVRILSRASLLSFTVRGRGASASSRCTRASAAMAASSPTTTSSASNSISICLS